MVYWFDAHFYMDADQESAHDERYTVKTVGDVTETEHWLRIASEYTPDGERAITYVHKSSVWRRIHLCPTRRSECHESEVEREGAGATDE